VSNAAASAPVDSVATACDPARMESVAEDSLHARCRLLSATPAAWVEAAIPALPTLLVEQAHLEKKAAAAAMRFLFSVGKEPWIQRALSCLAREELVHFERTLRLLEQRGESYSTLSPSRYADRLKAAIASTMPERAVDELLVSSLIEARSHERMEALGTALRGRDDAASEFYLDLVEAEARHRCVYLDIAASLVGEREVELRFARLAQVERAAVEQHDTEIRLHSGHGAHAGG
jgi:tRNA 2-(methylsulfanyl)-N6-isopentenyladenosine37 hydroxylase